MNLNSLEKYSLVLELEESLENLTNRMFNYADSYSKDYFNPIVLIVLEKRRDFIKKMIGEFNNELSKND